MNKKYTEEYIIDWHRLFGLSLMDYFNDKPFEVELERDMSVPQQFLDVIIIEQTDGQKHDLSTYCDGFQNLNKHNLLTYKSHHEPLDFFAIQELIGHYVSYRKMKENKLLKEKDISLYATCVRYPEKLFKTTEYKKTGKGIYEITVLELKIEIVVLSRIDKDVKNAILNYFSNNTEKVQFAFEVYRKHAKKVAKIFEQLLKKYLWEGLSVSLTIDSYIQEHLEDIVSDIPVELRLKGLDPEEIFKSFDPEDRLKGLDPEDRLKGLDHDQIKTLLKKYKDA